MTLIETALEPETWSPSPSVHAEPAGLLDETEPEDAPFGIWETALKMAQAIAEERHPLKTYC